MTARIHDMEKRPPLEGIRVVEFTTAWVGPGCGMMLAEMGADVVKVDNPLRPDLHRRVPPFADRKPGLNRGGWFALYNRGKKECYLDLKHPDGIDAAKRLVKISDIVIINFNPRVTDSLGLSYSTLKQVKPDLIMVAASGYGATGPDRNAGAYGQVLEAYTSLGSFIGYPDNPPQGCGLPISDHTSAVLSAFAALAALHHRDVTGEGQYIDVSEVESLLVCIPEAVMKFTMNKRTHEPHGNRDDIKAPHGCYRCLGDDDWIAVAVDSDQQWGDLCRIMGTIELIDDVRYSNGAQRLANQDELDKIITEWTKRRTSVDVMTQLQNVKVASGIVYNSEALYNDPHLRDREFFIAFEHPEIGKRDLPSVFAKLSDTPGAIKGREPLAGEHTDWVLNELLRQ
ncbi:CaiB/BaiF CoA transferase family protein [Chloroflexota bacterium]